MKPNTEGRDWQKAVTAAVASAYAGLSEAEQAHIDNAVSELRLRCYRRRGAGMGEKTALEVLAVVGLWLARRQTLLAARRVG